MVFRNLKLDMKPDFGFLKIDEMPDFLDKSNIFTAFSALFFQKYKSIKSVVSAAFFYVIIFRERKKAVLIYRVTPFL